MYSTVITLHNYIRWLVLAVMLYNLVRAWWGIRSKRAWVAADNTAVRLFMWVFSLQFFLGVILFFLPNGIAYAARQDFQLMMTVRELQFFGLEHPLQMTIALFVVHLGSSRARKTNPATRQFRWAAVCFTIAAVLILTAVPWWRPLLRGF